MRFKLAAVIAATLLSQVYVPPSADACGVKLTVKPTAPRKAVARTSNPSQVLLVGAPPKSLANDLTVAGHKVEVAGDPASAKRGSYNVVVVDSDRQASAAKERFGNNVVIVRSGNRRDDMRAVEQKVARTAVAVATPAVPVAARADREPVAVGPDRTRPEVAAAKPPEVAAVDPTPAPTPPAPTPPAPRIATTPAPRVEAPAPTPRPAKPVAATSAELSEEIYFGLGNKQVAKNRKLDRAIKWLTTNGSASVVIEGHADPTGTPEGNMTLSEERAEAVKAYLVDSGIDGGRIEVKALGDTQLKYGAADGRNRRASIRATK